MQIRQPYNSYTHYLRYLYMIFQNYYPYIYIPDIISKFPNFTDGSYSVSEVQKFCDEHNIKLEVEEVETSDYQDGAIYYQNKPEGYTIAEGVTLKIRVAKTPSEIESDNCEETGLC